MRKVLSETVRFARSRRVLRGLLLAVAVAAGLLVASGYLLAKNSTDTQDTATDSCVAALRVRDAMVAVLLDAQRRTNSTPAETVREKQRQDANDFYATSIRTLRAVNCTS